MVKKLVRGVVTTTTLEQGETAELDYNDEVKGLIDNGYAELADDTDAAPDRKSTKGAAADAAAEPDVES